MKLFSLLVLAIALAGISCERHEFEETRKLHEHENHGAGGHSEPGDHASGHGSENADKEHGAH